MTNSYARIFFSLWYFLGVLLWLNIVKSFFLMGFFKHHQTNKSEKVSENDLDLVNMSEKKLEGSAASDGSDGVVQVRDMRHATTLTFSNFMFAVPITTQTMRTLNGNRMHSINSHTRTAQPCSSSTNSPVEEGVFV